MSTTFIPGDKVYFYDAQTGKRGLGTVLMAPASLQLPAGCVYVCPKGNVVLTGYGPLHIGLVIKEAHCIPYRGQQNTCRERADFPRAAR